MGTKMRRRTCTYQFGATCLLAVLALCCGRSVAQQPNGSLTSPPLDASQASKPSVQGTSSAPLTFVPDNLADLQLSPGDQLHFSVFNEPEMEGNLRVQADGSVRVPLAGAVPVAGLNMVDAQKKIHDALVAGEYFTDPDVHLDVTQVSHGYVNVIGEVQSPGKITTLRPLTLEEALVQAGGVTAQAGGKIEIERANGGKPEIEQVGSVSAEEREAMRKILVAPGDTVRVPRAGIIYVLGSVGRPGGYLMLNRGQVNLLEALSLAGGTSVEASTGSIRIIHRDNGKIVETQVKLSDLTTHALALAPLLGDRDIVFVPANKLKSVFFNSSVIIAAAASSLVYRVP